MTVANIQKIELPDCIASTCVTSYTSSKVQGFVSLGYIAPQTLTFEEWLSAGEAIQKIDKFRNFAKGDWMMAGEHKFGEMYSQALDDEWGSYDKLRKLVWVARNVPLENRREDLTWTHHHHVAHLSTQEQREWLEYAAIQKISSGELKQALEQAGAKKKPTTAPELNWMPEEPKILPIPEAYTNGNGTNGHSTADSTYEQLADDLAGDESGYDWTKEETESPTLTYLDGSPINKPHVAQNSGNNEWYTPAEYIEAARLVMDAIDLDPASNPIANDVVKATTYYSANDDGLQYNWYGNVWMNPPYASGLIDRFISKLCCHYQDQHVDQAIVLVNNATETAWFQELANEASAFCFPRRRVRFWSPAKGDASPLQGQAVLYLGQNVDRFASIFGKFGIVMEKIGNV